VGPAAGDQRPHRAPPHPGAHPVSDVGLADALAHYAQGREITGPELAGVCGPLGIGEHKLAELMYQVSATDQSQARPLEEPCPLTPRELTVLRALAGGKLYKQISAEQGVSTSTIRTHLHNTYDKLGVPDRAQAVLLASRHGWL
jgi:DNA-binding NarL/FixJ family response regulator